MNTEENTKVIVTEFSGVQAAFMVSAVTSIHRLTWDRIEPPNQYVQAYSRESITGVLRIQDRVLFILDMEKILASLDSTLDMEPDKHFILADGANCVEKARRWLADEDMCREMTDAAYKLFRSRHTLEIRLKELAEQIPAALNGKRAEGWLAASHNYRLVRGLARSRALEASTRKPTVTVQDYWDTPVTVQRET